MSIDLHFYDGKPAWKIVVSDPGRFKGVNFDLEIKLFRLPRGPLVAFWLRLYDVPDQPFFLHRVLDPTDDSVGSYLAGINSNGSVVLVFESPGEQGDFAVELPVNTKGLSAVLEGALEYRERLGVVCRGELAVAQFLEVFTPSLESEKSVEAAWESVAEAMPYVPPEGKPPRPATSSWSGIGMLILSTFVCLGLGALARSWTPLAENAALETKVVRPGYRVRIYLGESRRSIGGLWRGEQPAFRVEGGQSYIDSVGTHSSQWGERITENLHADEAPPSFRPYLEVRLKDDSDLGGRILNGTAELRVVYPVFSGVAYSDRIEVRRQPVSIHVFTFTQFLLARASPLLFTLAFCLGLLTLLSLAGRSKAESTLGE